jgi:glycerol kinase
VLVGAIDQGSTSTKGAVVDARGRTVCAASEPVERRIDSGHVEHDPLALLAGVERVLERLLAAGPLAALGLACQRSTCLVWERASGRPLTPALSWQDRRHAAAATAMSEAADELEGEVARRTGLRLSPHYAALKLGGLLRAIPAGEERARSGELLAGTLDAFLAHRLTGRASTEPGQAGRTLLYSLAENRWDPWLCERFGVPAPALPDILPSGGARGECSGVPLAALLGDQQAALLGMGGWEKGVVGAHFGTGAFVLASTGVELVRAPALLSAVLASTAAERRFQLEGSVNSAGSAVDWACRLTGARLDAYPDPALEPERLPAVLPAFAGAGAPWWRPGAAAAIHGLDLSTTGVELVAGTLAGVAQRVLDCLEAIGGAGIGTDVLRLSGKLTRLSGLVGLLADAGQVPVEVLAAEESGLDGAARLAAAAVSCEAERLAAAPGVGARREPRWPAERAGAVRRRWREFAAAALELAPWPPGPV